MQYNVTRLTIKRFNQLWKPLNSGIMCKKTYNLLKRLKKCCNKS